MTIFEKNFFLGLVAKNSLNFEDFNRYKLSTDIKFTRKKGWTFE